jgi:heme-degrading monooxygenase HmoA
MIKRIVRMSFSPEHVEQFISIYTENWKHISGFPGCRHVELLRSVAEPSVFFTWSLWESEADLEAYRNSGLFKGIWASTRQLFNAKPEAWTLTEVLGN